jgi:hypothetical protein
MDSCHDALEKEKIANVRSSKCSAGRIAVVATTTTITPSVSFVVVVLLLLVSTTNAFTTIPLSSTMMMTPTPRTKSSNFPSIKSTRAADLASSSRSEQFRSFFPFPTRPRAPVDSSAETNGELYFTDLQQPIAKNNNKKRKMINMSTTTRATDMTNAQKISLNVAAVFVTTAVVAIVVDPSFRWTDSYYFQDVTETVLEATMPESTADVVCIVMAESAAGIVAAAITLLVNSMLMPKEQRTGTAQGQKGMVGSAVANGDFFVAKASADSVLSSLGVSPVAATVAAVAVAAVPAGIVKAAFAQKAMEQRKEEQEMQDVLDGRHNMNKKKIDLHLGLLNYLPQKKRQQELEAIAETNAKDSLVVEVVFDVIKWLVYAILCTELEGRILVDGMAPFPGLESAAFGTIASTAAKVYSDILYAYFGFGGILKQQEVRSRNLLQWMCTYTKEIISGATLFGVYELMQIPCKAIVAGFLSGGTEGCMGVEDMQACLAAYELVNPPTAGPEAEFRSLATAFASLWHQLPFVVQ